MEKIERRTYSKEYIEELRAWFATQTLPASMQIDKATFSPNLSKTVNRLLEQADICRKNPALYGGLLILEKIKNNLEEKQSRT